MSATQNPSPPPPERATEEVSSPSLRPTDIFQNFTSELRKQGGMVVPLTAMNLMWFGRLAITTSFLGRLGELQLAGGTLGLTFANFTGFSVLTGLCGAMEPICGQAFGAKNFKLLHKTLLMAILLLLFTALPVSFLWLNIDKILSRFGQPEDMIEIAKSYIFYLLPDLVITSFLCPLKAYLSAQGITIPIMLSSALAVALHIPINIFLSRAKGIQGVAMAVWVSDLIMTAMLAIYVAIMEVRKGGIWKEGGWWEQTIKDWRALLGLCGPCCLSTCLEWWCYEILILLTGRLPNAKQAVGVLAVILNFDYLLFSVTLALSVCASTRVSNELGANQPHAAYLSASVSLGTAAILGCVGAAITVGARDWWGSLFSHGEGVIKGVKKMMVLMALIELANFPLTVSGGIVRGTARPWLGMYASLSGFYFLALPVGAALAFKAKLRLGGFLFGFLGGAITSLTLLLVFIARINWVKEASKAQLRACLGPPEENLKDENEHKHEEKSVC